MKLYKPFCFSSFGIENKFKEYSKQVCIFIDGLWFDSKEYQESDYKVFVGGCEPEVYLRAFYTEDDIISNQHKFDLILSSNKNIVNCCNNAKLFPFGSCWLDKDFKKLENFFEVSFLCGFKDELIGHQLRHIIWNNLNHIRNIPIKKIFTTNLKKDYIFNTSQYSIIVENSSYENYFTEKIIDCLISKTIPIYFGCPNIKDYFDMKGFITFKTVEELLYKLSRLTPEIYESKLEHINKNYELALKYVDFHGRIDQYINEGIINNL